MKSPQELDPDIAKFLADAAASGAPPITAGSIADARRGNSAFLAAMRTHLDEVGRVENIEVPGADAALDARRYSPVGEPTSEVVFFHGGGWVLGDLDGHDQLCRLVCARANAVVLHVNYRHAPEHVFPAAALDAFAAVRWVSEEGSGLPLIVMGDSSGGNLAASAALQARDAGVAVALQVLLYPVLDSNLESASYRRNGQGYLLAHDDMVFFWDQYVPDKEDRSDPRASPLRADDLGGVAPAVIVVAGFDPLLDEATAYASRLNSTGVPVELLSYDSMVHGFSTLFAITRFAEHSLNEVAARIRAHSQASQPEARSTTA